MNEIGITERGDAGLDFGWLPWVKKGLPAILITKNPNELLGNLTTIDGYEKFNII
jgi:hypothetical protein